MKIVTNLSHAGLKASDFTSELRNRISGAHKMLRAPEIEYNKWVELPRNFCTNEMKAINKHAEWVRANCDVLLVLGIGGSFAGADAGLRLLAGPSSFPVEFLGLSFDATPIVNFLEKYKGKRICVNVISKSGTTLEPVAAFNVLEAHLRTLYPNQEVFKKHVIVTTGSKGDLFSYATSCGATIYTMPQGVGGRYSFLCAVGFFPLAVAGVDIEKIMLGATHAYRDLSVAELDKNEAYKYAAARYLLHVKARKEVEVFASFYEGIEGLGRWWQQLFGESEGKESKGLFVSPLVYSRDLHSMGQYIQQGRTLLFETILDVRTPMVDVKFKSTETPALCVPAESMTKLNEAAVRGTVKAHADAGVPVILLDIERLDAECFGYMIYFFEVACAASAYLLGVDPFDQPGVEFYKREMRELL